MITDRKLESLLHRTRIEHFTPGFSARVLQRARQLQVPALAEVLQRCFFWLAPAAVTAIALLAIHNARRSPASYRGIDAVFALQPVTLDAAYALDPAPAVP